jgi:hypothetical protein
VTSPVNWRDHYTELCRQGEAQGIRFVALGDYITQRMTDEELRAMLREWAPAIEASRERFYRTYGPEAAP